MADKLTQTSLAKPLFTRRRGIALSILGLLGAAAVPLMGVRGLVRPLRIHESSMAPALMGGHAVVSCPSCRREYAVEPFDASQVDRRSVCARCGTLHALTAPVRWHVGERVLIRAGRHDRLEQLRWRPVALRHPSQADDWLVKRLIGLPGETIQLRGGDVFVDGRRLVKPFEQFRQLAVPVCDTHGLPAEGDAAEAAWRRWQPVDTPTAWRREGTAYVSDPDCTGDWSWLAFQPTELAGHRPAGMRLLDDYPFNQSLSRQLYPVRDLLLRGELVEFRSGRFGCRVDICGEQLELIWERSGGWCELRSGQGKPRRVGVSPGIRLPERLVWEVALYDGQFHFAVEGKSQLTVRLPPAMVSTEGGIERLELGVQEAGFRLENLALLRDVYYLASDASGPGVDTPVALGPHELYVLGDNSPRSEDSRQFGPIDARRLLGPVLRWPW